MTNSTRIARTFGVVALGLTMLGATACSGGAGSDGEASVGMGTQPWLGYGPWYIAQENGYFTEQGVEVEITSFMNDSDMTAAFAGDRIQMANVASHTALQFAEQDLDVSIVLLLDASLSADAILTDGSVTDIAGLAGKQVAFEEGSVSNLLLGYALQQNGLSLADVQPVPMDPSEAATALIGGSVPAAVTYEPYISEARAAGDEFETIYTAAEKEGLISDVLVVDNTFLAENPEAVQKVVDSWGPAIDFYESDTDAARAIIAENVGSDVESLSSAFDGVQFFSLDDNATELSGSYGTEVLPSVAEISTQIGILEGGVDLSTLVDDSFVTGTD